MPHRPARAAGPNRRAPGPVDPGVNARVGTVIALVASLGLSAAVGATVARAQPFERALASLRGPRPVTVVLRRDGGHVTAGKDDPRRLRSGVVARSGYDWVDVAPYAGTDEQWQALVQCVQSQYDGFAVDIVDQAPATGEYVLAMVGGSSLELGFDDTVHGIAPWNGRVIDDAVVFVFQSPADDGQTLCETAAHEVGHALGLDHSRDCSDIMSYELCGPKQFQVEASVCGEWDDRSCGNGRARQSSDAELARNVGRR